GAGVLTPASWGMFSLRLPPFTPPRQPDEDHKVLLEALVELAGHAAAEGVWLAVEPINRYEDYMVNRLDQAVELGEEVERATGQDSVRVCADLFHMNIEEDDLAAAIRAAGPRIAHVHVDDTNRLQPGTGHMDFGSVFAALRDVGYDDWLTFECRLRGAPEEVLPASTRFLAGFLSG
ncbi:MAG TPA: sugar phosphate isomerase/epimerase family protein, partial [Actinomycetes bacterium]|nr:sugar phosphate isomerase/epimerase family protein [Actinomycetes bacterium]